MILRPYQTKAIDEARALVNAGKAPVIVNSPTGSGKTCIGCELIRLGAARGRRALFLCHRQELIDQTSAKLAAIGITHGVIKAGIKPTPAAVQIASVQTLARREPPPADLVIVDECHHANAGTWARVIAAYPNATVVGLTATPYRADGRGLGEVFRSIVTVTDIATLIRDGHLVPPVTYAPPPPDLSKVRIVAGDYSSGGLTAAMNRPKLVGDIVAHWRKLAADRITVVFATSIDHSQTIAQRFRDAGIAAEHVDGESDDRADILARLAAGTTRVVVNCGILTEGWDLPSCACVILARPTKSRGLWRQMCGRALRPAPGKADCVILDHAGNTHTHGLLTDPDDVSLDGIKRRAAGPAAPPVKMCPECFAALPGGTRLCPMCNSDIAPEPKPVAEEAGELRPVGAAKIPAAADYLKRAKLAQLEAVARAKGYKAGWVGYRFKDLFGHWPRPADRVA